MSYLQSLVIWENGDNKEEYRRREIEMPANGIWHGNWLWNEAL